MRIYNKWYKELWWWIVENASWFLTIGIGILLGVLFSAIYCWFLER